MLIVACGTHEWRPPPHVDQISVANDLIARVEADSSVSVTAIVTYDGQTAAGAVRFRQGDLQSALASPHVRLARARAWQALAEMMKATPDRSYEAAQGLHGARRPPR